MRTIVIVLAGVSALAFAAQPASAQDRESFTGPRAEVTAGYDATHADDGVAATPNTLEGARIGGAIGYDLAVGSKFTIGAEAGFGFAATGDIDTQIGTTNLRLTSGRDLDLMLRAGVKVTPSTLLYVKGGYANSRFNLRTTVGGVGGNSVTKVGSNEDGWRVGAGVEQMINDHFYAKAEYRYTDYGSDVNRHQALVGLGYRF